MSASAEAVGRVDGQGLAERQVAGARHVDQQPRRAPAAPSARFVVGGDPDECARRGRAVGAGHLHEQRVLGGCGLRLLLRGGVAAATAAEHPGDDGDDEQHGQHRAPTIRARRRARASGAAAAPPATRAPSPWPRRGRRTSSPGPAGRRLALAVGSRVGGHLAGGPSSGSGAGSGLRSSAGRSSSSEIRSASRARRPRAPDPARISAARSTSGSASGSGRRCRPLTTLHSARSPRSRGRGGAWRCTGRRRRARGTRPARRGGPACAAVGATRSPSPAPRAG